MGPKISISDWSYASPREWPISLKAEVPSLNRDSFRIIHQVYYECVPASIKSDRSHHQPLGGGWAALGLHRLDNEAGPRNVIRITHALPVFQQTTLEDTCNAGPLNFPIRHLCYLSSLVTSEFPDLHRADSYTVLSLRVGKVKCFKVFKYLK